MFDLANWTDPETLWLNLTNLGLGILTLWLLLDVGWSFLREFLYGHEQVLKEEAALHHGMPHARVATNHRLFRIALKKARTPMHRAGF
jgi:hypothetical protein